MSDTVIQVENLGKKYVIGRQQAGAYQYTALRDVIADGVRSLGRKLRQPDKRMTSPNREEFWALKDISFEVKQGDVIGIIGRNGAGKSTLLKILSRITEPTTGRVKLKGRVASLLEVGTGFHPELTGRENIFLNGAILGMSKTEINRKFDEIVEFAEISRFLDTPVKRYSSGMYVRLAFAVAAHLEPEILVIDEVLAVGDAAFQKKCLGKISSVAQEGRTILFVSHNMGAIKRLTQKSIYFERGSIKEYSQTSVVIEKYMQDSQSMEVGGIGDLRFYRRDRFTSSVNFKGIWAAKDSKKTKRIPILSDFSLFFLVSSKIEARNANITINLKAIEGDIISITLSSDANYSVNLDVGDNLFRCDFKDLNLNQGSYLIDVGVNRHVGGEAWDVILDYPALEFINTGNERILHRSNREGFIICRNVSWNKENLIKDQILN